MKNTDLFGEHITQAYASLIKQVVQLKYPNFYFERGVIMYDYDNETYVYLGYTETEMQILKEAAIAVQRN
jgi:hypothetical protein